MKVLIRKIAGFQDVEIFTQFSGNLILAWAFLESHCEVQDDVFNLHRKKGNYGQLEMIIRLIGS